MLVIRLYIFIFREIPLTISIIHRSIVQRYYMHSEYSDRKMNFCFSKHQQRILNLWRYFKSIILPNGPNSICSEFYFKFLIIESFRTLFKSLLGRYYRASEGSKEGGREEIQASFKDAKTAIKAHTEEHISQKAKDEKETKWEELS